ILYSTSRLLIRFLLSHTSTTRIYTLSLHDALPISIMMIRSDSRKSPYEMVALPMPTLCCIAVPVDSWHIFEQSGRLFVPSTRARSEEHTSELHHVKISYAVFCLKKKKNKYGREKRS